MGAISKVSKAIEEIKTEFKECAEAKQRSGAPALDTAKVCLAMAANVALAEVINGVVNTIRYGKAEDEKQKFVNRYEENMRFLQDLNVASRLFRRAAGIEDEMKLFEEKLKYYSKKSLPDGIDKFSRKVLRGGLYVAIMTEHPSLSHLLKDPEFIAKTYVYTGMNFSKRYPNNEVIKNFVKNIPNEHLLLMCEQKTSAKFTLNEDEKVFVSNLAKSRGLACSFGDEN